jgi:hypothetical protein
VISVPYRINPFTKKLDYYEEDGGGGEPGVEVLSGHGNPNGHVTGVLGQMYLDLDIDIFYICVQNNSKVWIVD